MMFGPVVVLNASSSHPPEAEARSACLWLCTKDREGLILAHSRVKLVAVYCLVGIDIEHPLLGFGHQLD